MGCTPTSVKFLEIMEDMAPNGQVRFPPTERACKMYSLLTDGGLLALHRGNNNVNPVVQVRQFYHR